MGFELDLDMIYDLMLFEQPFKIHHMLLQFLMSIMVVFDEWYNGVLVAYIITSSYNQHHLAPWMDVLNKRLLMFQNDWHPNAFIVDDAKVEINSLRYINDFTAR
jgi:hypothetical protein